MRQLRLREFGPRSPEPAGLSSDYEAQPCQLLICYVRQVPLVQEFVVIFLGTVLREGLSGTVGPSAPNIVCA